MVYCDMDTDAGAGYTLVWKNVGGNLKSLNLNSTAGLLSDRELLRSSLEDIVLPVYSGVSQREADVSQFQSVAYGKYSTEPYTEVSHL